MAIYPAVEDKFLHHLQAAVGVANGLWLLLLLIVATARQNHLQLLLLVLPHQLNVLQKGPIMR